MDIPTRSEWSTMDWYQAQTTVTNLLQHRGYMRFHEKHVSNGRIDGLVIKKSTHEICIGIIEVKHYRKSTKKLYETAVIQALKYLQAAYEDILAKYIQDKRSLRFFVAAVFTNDYPVMNIDEIIEKHRFLLPGGLIDSCKVDIIYTAAEHLIKRLTALNYIEPEQSDLKEFFA